MIIKIVTTSLQHWTKIRVPCSPNELCLSCTARHIAPVVLLRVGCLGPYSHPLYMQDIRCLCSLITVSPELVQFPTECVFTFSVRSRFTGCSHSLLKLVYFHFFQLQYLHRQKSGVCVCGQSKPSLTPLVWSSSLSSSLTLLLSSSSILLEISTSCVWSSFISLWSSSSDLRATYQEYSMIPGTKTW